MSIVTITSSDLSTGSAYSIKKAGIYQFNFSSMTLSTSNAYIFIETDGVTICGQGITTYNENVIGIPSGVGTIFSIKDLSNYSGFIQPSSTSINPTVIGIGFDTNTGTTIKEGCTPFVNNEYSYVNFYNCSNNFPIVSVNGYEVGGIGCYNFMGTIYYSTNTANIGSNCAGICGTLSSNENNNSGVISTCSNSGSLSGNSAGICYTINSNAYLELCTNSAVLTTTCSGICYNNNGTITNCISTLPESYLSTYCCYGDNNGTIQDFNITGNLTINNYAISPYDIYFLIQGKNNGTVKNIIYTGDVNISGVSPLEQNYQGSAGNILYLFMQNYGLIENIIVNCTNIQANGTNGATATTSASNIVLNNGGNGGAFNIVLNNYGTLSNCSIRVNYFSAYGGNGATYTNPTSNQTFSGGVGGQGGFLSILYQNGGTVENCSIDINGLININAGNGSTVNSYTGSEGYLYYCSICFLNYPKSLIENCSFKSLNPINNTGNTSFIEYYGLIASTNQGTIDYCFSETDYTINGSNECIGSIAGTNSDGGVVENSYAIGNLNNLETQFLGGIVGYNTGTIKNVYFVGTMSSSQMGPGGICGINNIGYLQYCFTAIQNLPDNIYLIASSNVGTDTGGITTSWDDSSAVLYLTGAPTLPATEYPAVGSIWTSTGPNTPFILTQQN